MDKKTFFHKVSQMRAVQREYFKTRSSAALASSKLLERQIDEEIKRANAVMTAKARLFYELVDIDPQTSQEWLNDHIRASLDFFFCGKYPHLVIEAFFVTNYIWKLRSL